MGCARVWTAPECQRASGSKSPPSVGQEQDRTYVLAQTLKLACIVPKQIVPPNRISILAAILGHCRTDCFIRSETGAPQFLRFAQHTENKDPLCQALRNSS